MPFSDTTDGIETAMKPVGTVKTPPNSNIKVTRRDERRLFTHLIHVVISPFRNFLGRPPKGNFSNGSPVLKPTQIAKKTCKISERTVCDIHIYDICPRLTHQDNVTKRIYYFCGGGWQSQASPQHWQLCTKLARQIPDIAISLVSYPLAPNDPAPKAFPALLKLYRALLELATEAGEKIILAGDSAGGNIVLALTLEALREEVEHGEKLGGNENLSGRSQPTAIVAISPSTDLTRSNPDIRKLAQHDPILTPDFVTSTAHAWAGEWDPADRRLSPLYADVSLLAKAGIKVHGITGGYDILMPDAIKFREQCEAEGVVGEWLEWDKQMHCFVLSWPYGVPEAREAVGWLIDVLKKE